MVSNKISEYGEVYGSNATCVPEAIELQIEDPSQLDDTNVEGGYEIQEGESPAGTAARQDGPGY